MTGLVAQILPDSAATAELRTDPPGLTLLPEEEAVVAGSVPRRRREFTTVRHCARAALREIGVPAAPILPGERGAPAWPAGVVGSMTHCEGFRGAAVARAGDLRTIGLDAEPSEPLPDGVLDAIALSDERTMVERLSTSVPADRLLFSAKETVYKAWFPLTHRFLQFEEARVELGADGTFHAMILAHVPGAPRDFQGRWLHRDGLLVTSIAVPAWSDRQ